MSSHYRTLGIMASFQGDEPTFKEKSYYKMLTLAGRRLEIRVFVFSPRMIDFEEREVTGFEYHQDDWVKRKFPLPQVVYDRCFMGSVSRKRYKPLIERLQQDDKVTFLGNGLSGKWQVYQTLSQSEELRKWLPETYLFSIQRVNSLLVKEQDIIVKPAAGTHGLSVIRVSKRANGEYEVTGRNQVNERFTKKFNTRTGLQRFLLTFTANRPFIIQPYLTLHTPAGTPYDVRVLVQKNGEGKWETTGKAVRMGEKHGITSNLHGGGKAVALSPFLFHYFGQKRQILIEQEINSLISQVPVYLESSHGRLVELGIDIGIDTAGNVWIIEVNSRPGRTVFRHIDDQTARIRSMTQPVKYAEYLMNERVGGY